MRNEVPIESLLGKTIAKVIVNREQDKLHFFMSDDSVYMMCHEQDCCENVEIEDINGDLNDLIGVPLLQAEMVTNSDNPKPDPDYSFTWTFYKFATIKGYVTLRWYGTSNGYYSESVEIFQTRLANMSAQ